MPDDDNGLLQSVTYGMGANYSWTTVKRLGYFTEKHSGSTYQPHIGLITLHEENADDETLLLGELAACECKGMVHGAYAPSIGRPVKLLLASALKNGEVEK